MFFRCEAIVSLFQLMELATIQSTTDFKASWHSLDERPQKKGVWGVAHFKGFQAFSGSGSITCFITFPDSSTKYFETPAIQIGAVLEKKGRRQGFLQMMSHDTTSTGKEGKGVKGGVTRSARSPCPLPTLYLLTPHHHLLVNVLPPPKLVWNIS